MSLPFIKGLTGVYPDAEIFMISKPHFRKMQEFAPYIHHFIEDETMISGVTFDFTVDLENLANNISTDKVNFDQVQAYKNFHYSDTLLACLPKKHQTRSLNLSETLDGFEEMKSFAMKTAKKDFDVVLYPFSNLTDKESFGKSWKLEDFHMFIMYFFKMNPGKKILLLALESQRKEITQFLKDKPYPEDLVKVKICTIDCALSVLKRSSFVITANSPMKFLTTNPETTLVEINFNDEDFENKCSYRGNSYVINFKKQVRNKFIYTSNELAFDNNAHFFSYVITSILDGDEEKLRWFAEKYTDLADIYKTTVSQEIGFKLLPIYWGQKSISKSLVNISHKLQVLQVNNPKHSEEFYYGVHDDSDLTQDQIMYDLGAVQKEIERLIKYFRTETHFAIAIKIENNEGDKLGDYILQQILDQSLESVKDERPSKMNELIIEKLLVNLFFIRQVMNVSGQKLLESLPMTGVYYS
jgi:hypothetical protein